MSLYYILNKDHYEGDEKEIGEIMERFCGDLYDETGLNLCLNLGSSDEIFPTQQGLKLEYLTEEVLWKNMTEEDKARKVIDHINLIRNNGGELLIIDPYLFSKPQGGYANLLIHILQNSNFENIVIITDKHNIDNHFMTQTQNAIGGQLKVYYSKDFHDRYWIADKQNGFSMGTSLNGLGKKYCTIQLLDKQDVIEIIKIATNIIVGH